MRSSTYEEEGTKKNKNKGLGWILKNCDDCFMIDKQWWDNKENRRKVETI